MNRRDFQADDNTGFPVLLMTADRYNHADAYGYKTF